MWSSRLQASFKLMTPWRLLGDSASGEGGRVLSSRCTDFVPGLFVQHGNNTVFILLKKKYMGYKLKEMRSGTDGRLLGEVL